MEPGSDSREDWSGALHEPVLLDEVLLRLRPMSGETHVDGTIGTGGHAVEILKRLGSSGLLVGIDRDPEALQVARARLEATGLPFRIVQGLYSEVSSHLRSLGLSGEGAVDGLLLDLGVSSLQLDRPERGFSFLRDGPLDMRMGPGSDPPAVEYLRSASAREIERILREYGEEPAARRIARAIEQARRSRSIEKTLQLAEIVESVVPRRGQKTHPATRTFQGIRIAVNRELEHLRSLLRDLDRVICPGGRVVVLSYHSLEDRLVKQSLGAGVRSGLWEWVLPCLARPGPDETRRNPRSRSARLRAVVRSGAPLAAP